MGSYTGAQKYYLINSTDDVNTELVDVDEALNYNVQRADERLKPLVQWQVTNAPIIATSSLPRETGFKWYKTDTNSVWVCSSVPTGGTPAIRQDNNSQINTWAIAGITFEPGYTYQNSDTRIAYSVMDGWVNLRGTLIRSGSIPFERNVTINFMTLPASIMPNKACYFMISGGASPTFALARLYIPAASTPDKRLEVCVYEEGLPTEHTLCLNNIRYPLNDTATS